MIRMEIEKQIFNFNYICSLLQASNDFRLTAREIEIICMLLHQWSVPSIANYLCRQENTINKHIENIKRKMSCHTTFMLGVKITEHISQLQENSR